MDIDIGSIINVVFRWAHITFGVLWLGHLFFLNLVNVPLQKELDDETKIKVNPKLLLRVFYWFRQGAMVTFVAGWLLFGYKYGHQKLLFVDGALSNRAIWVLYGALLGSIMWFNVWFVIWPRQRALLGSLISGQPLENAAALAATASKASRMNLFMSGPLLWAMIMPNNYPGLTPWAIVVITVLGVGFWFGHLKKAAKLKAEV